MERPATSSPSFLRPVEARRAFEEILGQLEEAITTGHLSAGDRLPSERELAASFEVSRTSVREALRVLEALGIVRVRRGGEKGATFLQQPGNAFAHILRLLLALQHIRVEDLVEFRSLIESWAASVLAEQKRPDTFRELARLVVEMETRDLDAGAFHEIDVEFHARIVRASGNTLAMLIHEGAQSAIRRIMLRSLFVHDAQEWPIVRQNLAADHRDLYSAITGGESVKASELMSKHIHRWGRRAAEVDSGGAITR